MCILRTRVRFCWLHMSHFLSRGLTYKLWISRYWYIFSNKFWSEHLAHTCLEAKCRNQKLRMLTTKYCLLGRNFICIAYVSIELQKSSPGGGIYTTPKLHKGLKWLGTEIERFSSKLALLENKCFSKTYVVKKVVLHLWSNPQVKILENLCEGVHLSLLKMIFFRKCFPRF